MFFITILEVLELFRCLLGAFWGFRSLSWEASGPQKPSETEGFLWFFERHLFAALELLRVLWEPSWRAQGRSGTQNGAKRSPKMVQKFSRNCLKFDPKNGPKKDPEITTKWSPKSITPGGPNRVFLGSFSGSWPRGPRGCPRWAKRVPRWSRTGPRQG